MSQIDIQAMLDNAVHFGHRSQKWCPKMKPYIHATRSGIHVFDLEQTAKKLQEVLAYLKDASSQGKSILFVSTKPQTVEIIPEIAKATGNPSVSYKWICGTLTNFGTVRKRISYLNNLKSDAESGGFDRYTKKEGSMLRKEMTKLEQSLGGIVDMKKLPDIVFVVDAKRDANAVKEARKKKIPVVGFADSNADPEQLDMFFPANDDAMKSLKYILDLVKDAILEGKKGGAKTTKPQTPAK